MDKLQWTDPFRTVLCPTCGHEVSRRAETCPACGEPIRDNPAVRPHSAVIMHVALGLAMAALLLWFGLSWLAAVGRDAERTLQRQETGALECPKNCPKPVYVAGLITNRPDL